MTIGTYIRHFRHYLDRYSAISRTFSVALVLLFVLILSIQDQTFAADASKPSSQSALAVSPAITEQILTRNTKTQLKLQVTNITRVPLPIKGSVKNLTPLEDLLPDADRSTYDASAWFTLEPADFIIQPNQTKDISVTITTPAKATPGGHYATVYFQPLVPEEALTPSTAYLNARVGVLAFLIVKGDIEQQARLDYVHVPRLKQFGPVNIDVAIANTGNVHTLPQGKISIRNILGKTVSEVPLTTGIVLPDTRRIFNLEWNNDGRLGFYTAQAEITYSAEHTMLRTGRIVFFVLPWIVILLLAAIAGFGGWFVVRTRRRWKAAWNTLRGHD